MRISVRGAGSPTVAETSLIAIPWRQSTREVAPPLDELDRSLGGSLSQVIASEDFVGKKGQSLVLYGGAQSELRRVALIGLGEEDTPEGWREAGGAIANIARELGQEATSVWIGASPGGDGAAFAQALAEGLALGAWRFDELRRPEDQTSPLLDVAILIADADDRSVEALSAASQRGGAIADGQNLARELAILPPNLATPAHLAERAREIGKRCGIEVSVLGPKELRAENMNALLAVAEGSDQEPRFIVMEYSGSEDGPPLVLVGKGVTFDSGGLSLKPPSGMETMKYDMSGAAAVLGAMQAIGELKPRVNVVALIPSVENMPSAHALRPGDVIRSHSGVTIEVLNTDAEGRLILADALSYASRYEPRAMVDIATLTGACVVALGHHAIGLLGTDPTVVADLEAAADRSGERVWELPLWDEYREQLKSDIADIKNTGGRPAGTVTAGMFLREFTGSIPWAHLDIAGTAWANEAGSYQPKGPTGVGVRLFTEWVTGQST